MRIIAGQFRSRILKPLKGQSLRPTSDYLRETLFNVLGPDVDGAGRREFALDVSLFL